MRMPAALVLLLLPALTAPAAERQVALVVDSSATMSRSLADQNTRIGAVRDVLFTLAAVLPPDDAELQLSLDVFGGGAELTDPEACSDQRLLLPMAAFEPSALAAASGTLAARGCSPLAAALRAAAGRFTDAAESRRLILFTDGWDSCGGDVSAVIAETLKEAEPEDPETAENPLRIHVIAISTPPEVNQRFTTAATVHPVQTGAEIATALAKALRSVAELELEPRPLQLELVGAAEPMSDLTLSFVSAVTGNELPYPVTADAPPFKIPAGIYSLRIEGLDETKLEFSRLEITRDTPHQLTLEVPDHKELVLTGPEESVEAGAVVPLQYSGVALADAWISLAPLAARAHDERVRRPLEGPSGTVELMVPPAPGLYEARLELPTTSGGGFIAARLKIAALPPPEAWFDAPAELETGDAMTVLWSGPEAAGDLVVLAEQDQDVEAFLHWWPASEAPHPLQLLAPMDGCTYELRYLVPYGMAVAARAPIVVTRPEAELRGPEDVVINDRFEVRWRGPAERNDYVTIVAPEAPDGDYRQLVPVASGNPVLLEAPPTPGLYEMRYMSGHGARVLDRVPLEVRGIAVTLEAPAAVKAGSRFTLRWTGPDLPGDFIGIYRPQAPTQRHEEFGFTSLGSPMSLAAPFNPGRYVIRYVSGADAAVVGERELQVK